MMTDFGLATAARRSVVCVLVLATAPPLCATEAAAQTVQELKRLSDEDLFDIEVTTVSRTESTDAQLAWRARKDLEISVVGQNLLDNRHPEFGTSPLVRSPLVETRRGVHGKTTWRF